MSHRANKSVRLAGRQRKGNRVALLSNGDFIELLRFETERSNRAASAFSIAIFSAVQSVHNDREVLQHISQFMETYVRCTDILGWYGSDSIAALFLLADRGRRSLSDQLTLECGNQPLRVTVNTYPIERTENRGRCCDANRQSRRLAETPFVTPYH
jgi:hypothetical protein